MNNINEQAINDVLELANELVGTRTFFIGVLDDHFSVMKVFTRGDGSKLAEGLVLPLDQSV